MQVGTLEGVVKALINREVAIRSYRSAEEESAAVFFASALEAAIDATAPDKERVLLAIAARLVDAPGQG